MKFLKQNLGQATVEYVLLFAFMSAISVSIVKSIGNGVSTSVGSLGYSLSQQLHTGICKRECFYTGYQNGLD